MTELERRAQLADELSEIMMRMMRDTGVLTRIVSALFEGKPVGPISAVLKRYGGEHCQAYGDEVLEAAKIIGPELVSRKPRQRRRKFKSLGGNVMQFPH